MELGKVEKGSVGYYSQQIIGTGASFLAYAVAGKVMGKGLRIAGEAAPLEMSIGEVNIGSSIRAVAQDARVATVLGATTYAGFRDTKGDETHLSNAASTFVGFTMFEAGNSLLVKPGASLLDKMGTRAVVGFLGGDAQVNVASKIQTGKWADKTEVDAAGLSGAALNALLPGGKSAVDHALESPLVGGLPHTTDAVARLHVEAAQALPKGQAPEPGSWADPKAIKALNVAARADLHTKVKLNDDGPTRIDQKKNVVFHAAGDDPLNVLQELAHRRIYKDPAYEQAFKSHAKDIQSPDPADPKNAVAREGYIKTRLDQEVAARTAQNAEAEKLNAPRRVSVDANEIRTKEGYGANFEHEADEFITSGGKSRPALDNSGGAAGHGGGHSGDGGHDVNTASHAHAENVNHGSADGVGGGTGARTTATEISGTHEAVDTTDGEEAEHEDKPDPRFRPEVDEDNIGQGKEPPSDEYPRGRTFDYIKYPGGAHINGHDNVIREARYDDSLDEVMLVKEDPITHERSAVRLRNDGLPVDITSDGRGGTIQASSVEKFYYNGANAVPPDLLFDSNLFLRGTRYEVSVGNDLVPDGSTYSTFTYPQRYVIDGVPITPTASVEYNNASGRIDYHQDEPFQNVITEWPKPIEDANVRYRVTVPQTIPGSHRVFALDADNKPMGVVDVFSAEHPLDTDFGPVRRVDRQANSSLYHLVDGSSVKIGHFEGRMFKTHQIDGVDTDTIYEGNDGYSEKYSKPWESVFGLVNEVKTTPTKAEYHLVNNGVAELYRQPIEFGNFKSVDWVYHDPNGDKVIQLHGSNTRVRIPKDGIETGIASVPKAEAVSTFAGAGGFTRYYRHNGDVMDVLPSNPSRGIIRKPGQISFIDGVGEDWREATFLFEQGKLPKIATSDPVNGTRIKTQPLELCLDDVNNFLAVVPEKYPGGLLTKWGLATKRDTYWTGGSHLTIKDESGLSTIELDRDGNKVTRGDDGAVVGIEPEPASYPNVDGALPPRSH
jgi:hypothetical protein